MSIAKVAELLRATGRPCLALTGAGVSTESGIPDYRSPNGLYNTRPNFQPLTIQKFLKNDFEKKRYWARSMFGYFGVNKQCNAAHTQLHALAAGGMASAVVTQNVDGLHHLARHGNAANAMQPLQPLFEGAESSRRKARHEAVVSSPPSGYDLVELHGNIHMVRCMACGDRTHRADLQPRLEAANPQLLAHVRVEAGRERPDADYDLDEGVIDGVCLVHCAACGGHLRPDVVLFGENVPTPTVDKVAGLVGGCGALLCLGTSLQVFSSFRFVKMAHEQNIPVVIINRGPTRGDPLATVKVDDVSVSVAVSEIADLLSRKP